jgi:hypothetical protein
LEVDVPRDGPDQLETVQQGGQGVVDRLEVALVDVFELALQSQQEFYEVLCDRVLLFKVLFFLFKSFYVVTVLIFPDIAKDLDNAAHAWHTQLLVKSVIRGCALGPELRLAGSGIVLLLGCALGFSLHLLDDHFGP